MRKKINFDIIKTGLAPRYGTPDSACFDLMVPNEVFVTGHSSKVIPLGIRFQLPKGYHLHMIPRSSAFYKYSLIILDSIIDNDYHDEVHCLAFNTLRKATCVPALTYLVQCKLVKDIPCKFKFAQFDVGTRGRFGSTDIPAYLRNR
jgi:dUTP pyrophosphatase